MAGHVFILRLQKCGKSADLSVSALNFQYLTAIQLHCASVTVEKRVKGERKLF